MAALITGASSGIGLELARIFAENGHDVVLVARSEGKLQTLASELQSRGRVRTEVIANELEGTGVTVTALCPGPTASGFQAAAKLEESKLVAGKTLPSSREVARAGYDALMHGTRVFVPGLANKVTVQLPRVFPRSVITKVVRNVQERRR